MKASIDFYTTVLGFLYDHGVREIAWLTRPGMLLTLSPGQPKAELSCFFGWSVGSLDELQQYYDALYSRGLRVSSPPDASAGRPYFYLFDPDDYPVGFSCDPLDYPERA
jgi:catechol 2,3-dioxygenase-like lactoylglutathione lyase family enzyme